MCISRERDRDGAPLIPVKVAHLPRVLQAATFLGPQTESNSNPTTSQEC